MGTGTIKMKCQSLCLFADCHRCLQMHFNPLAQSIIHFWRWHRRFDLVSRLRSYNFCTQRVPLNCHGITFQEFNQTSKAFISALYWIISVGRHPPTDGASWRCSWHSVIVRSLSPMTGAGWNNVVSVSPHLMNFPVCDVMLIRCIWAIPVLFPLIELWDVKCFA